MQPKPSWIAVDWGTTHLRAWAMGGQGERLAERSSAKGMGALLPDEFEPALLELAEDWLAPATTTPVIACGMVGARQGWVEADYVTVPARPITATKLCKAPTTDKRISVLIVPGLKQISPPDVLRGEETQIAGLVASRPDFSGLVCMPGTHSKWVRVEAGRVTAFKTVMTGELFALLAAQSILRHSLSGDEAVGLDLEVFDTAISAAFAHGGPSLADLFTIRAAHLVEDAPPTECRARLSALLIGAEISATRHLWQGGKVLLLGTTELMGLYERALSRAGADTETTDGRGLTITGLVSAYELVRGPAHV